MPNYEEADEELKSKTQIKQELHDLKKLGAALIDLPKNVYDQMPIPEKLDIAIKESKRIKSHIAQKRQLQYIGKIMRLIEVEEIKAIETAYNEWKNGRKTLAREHQQLEILRDKLIEGDKEALITFINDHPGCDIQHLRQIVRLAQQEKKLEKPPKNFRKLFQLLKDIHDI